MAESDRDGFKRVKQVVLAHEAPFALGDLQIHPDTLQVEQDGRSDTLEPRVMQVLVVLARAHGKIVTRDELIEQCWDGRVVGEDAINRALSRVRHCAAGFAGGCFAVETIPRVGYRLTANAHSSDRPLTSSATDGTQHSRRWILRGAAGAALLGTGAVLWQSREQHEPLPQAMKLYLRGLENRGQASLQQSEEGVSYFREATRLDPQFAEAWGALAWGYRGLLAYGPRPDAASIETKSRSAAMRALELDPNNVDAHSALLLLAPFYRRWREVEIGCRRLLRSHPQNSILDYNLGFVLCEVGRWRDAIPSLAAVVQREQFWPLPSHQLAYAMIAAGRMEEAEDVIDAASRRWPRRADFWMLKHRLLLFTGRESEAASFANDLLNRPVGEEQLVRLQTLIQQAVVSGPGTTRDRVVSQLLAQARDVPHHFLFASLGISLLGAVDQAFEMSEGYYFGRGPWAANRAQHPITQCLFIPATMALRGDPRFPALVKEIGLPRYWQASRLLPDYLRYA